VLRITTVTPAISGSRVCATALGQPRLVNLYLLASKASCLITIIDPLLSACSEICDENHFLRLLRQAGRDRNDFLRALLQKCMMVEVVTLLWVHGVPQ
jgi:hypothetical protein